MGGWGWGMAITGWVFMLAIIGLVVWGIVFFSRGTSTRPSGRSPLDIAKERYARGEITREEYKRLESDLQGCAATIPTTRLTPDITPPCRTQSITVSPNVTHLLITGPMTSTKATPWPCSVIGSGCR